MKRGGPLPRKAPLRSSKPIVPGAPLRSAPLSRRSGLSGVSSGSPVAGQPLRLSRPKVDDPASSPVADVPRVKSPRPKRPKVTAEEKRARDLVYARSGHVCEGCAQVRATDWSHRIGRAVGGRWCASNGLHLCRRCHDWIGAEPAKARDLGWRLESTDDPLTFPAVLFAHGRVLLNPDGDYVPAERNDAA